MVNCQLRAEPISSPLKQQLAQSFQFFIVTSCNAVRLKGSKLPKLSRLVYVVEVIQFYMF